MDGCVLADEAEEISVGVVMAALVVVVVMATMATAITVAAILHIFAFL